jgi:hypothetical protein
LVESLARGVQAAHEQHILHRDLKPANVLLAADGTPKITDFGLAKHLDAAELTQSGTVMGTPSYMAPEQARGQKAVTPAVDVYALGAILYECLTGRPPFCAATAAETLMQVLHEEPLTPRSLNPAVPRELETIVLKCLAKDPAGRYASASEVGEELGRYLKREPIQASRAGLFERLRKRAARRPAVACLLVMLLFLAGASVVVSSLFVRQALQARYYRQRGDEKGAALWYMNAVRGLDHGRDLNSYRNQCAGMLTQFRDTHHPQTAFIVCLTSALGPGAVENFTPLVRLADLPFERGYSDEGGADMRSAECLCVRGSILYRSGWYEQGIESLELARNLDATFCVWRDCFLAMAYTRQGRHKDAAARLKAASATLASNDRFFGGCACSKQIRVDKRVIERLHEEAQKMSRARDK